MNFKTKKMMRLTIACVLAIGAIFFAAKNWHAIPVTYYSWKWSHDFNAITSLDLATEAARQSRDIFVHKFPNGEWLIARCEHACCTGAGYNLSIIHVSQGSTYRNTSHAFCGKAIDGIIRDFEITNNRQATSIEDFLSHCPIPLNRL